MSMGTDIDPARVCSRRLPRRPAIGYSERMKNALTVGEPRPDFFTRSNPMSGENPPSPSPLEGEGRGGGSSGTNHRSSLPTPSLRAGVSVPQSPAGAVGTPHPNPPPQGGRGRLGGFSYGPTPCPVRTRRVRGKCTRYDPMHRETAPPSLEGEGRGGGSSGTGHRLSLSTRPVRAGVSVPRSVAGAVVTPHPGPPPQGGRRRWGDFLHGRTPCPVRIGPRASLPDHPVGPAA